MTTGGQVVDLVARSRRLADLAERRLALEPRAPSARERARRLRDHLEGFVLPRAADIDAPLLVVLIGSTGAGKSSLLNRLTGSQRTSLISAMHTVERLLLAGAVRLHLENPRSRAAQSCIARYFEELAARFEAGFDPTLSIPVAAEELTPPRGCFILATLHGEPVGCGALRCHAACGEIKRMWVAPSARGLGIGRRILQRLEELARRRRIPLLRLETNKALSEAQALYRSSGYREVSPFNDEPYAHHWFQKRLRTRGR